LTIKALLFDVFGTVVDWRVSIRNDLEQWSKPLGITRDWEAFAQDWRALYQPAMESVRNGQRSYVRLDILHRESLDSLLTAYDLEDLSAGQRDHINRVWHRLQPWDDVLSGLMQLKPHYILATLSNGNIEMMVNIARNANLPWDMILGAEVAQTYKPQPQAYLVSMDMLGLEPCQCLMVAAHNQDLRQAASLGMKTAFISRPTEYGERQTVDFEAEDDWDFDCSSMVDLANRLSDS
jgi:2-haloacid dehalogenase